MDRRSLLAILLSTLVIIVFNMYFLPKPKPPAPAPAGQDSARAVRHDSSLASPPGTVALAPDTLRSTAAGSGLAPTTGVTDTTFNVAVDGAAAGFTSRGGGLLSWKLLRFDGPAGGPVELVRNGPEPHVVLDLGTARIDPGDALFRVERQTLPGGVEQVSFHAGDPNGVEIIKRYRIDGRSPMVDFEVEVRGVPATATDPAIEVGWSGLPRAERVEKVDRGATGSIVSLGKDIQRFQPGKFRKEKSRRLDGAVQWVGARNKYFLAGIVPPSGAATAAIASGDATENSAGAAVRVPIVSGAASRHLFKLYLGPLDYWHLKKVGFGLERAVDLGWKFILPVSQALLWLLVQGYRLIPNYGVVIILLSALTRLIFYPLMKGSMRSMRAMQTLQPEMERLRKKYKDDPTRLNTEVMGLYKKHGVNPLGGCLPTLLQMPVFIALYTVLANSVELRHAGFALWINDLSAPDTLLKVGGFEIHVLPILMAATMFWQQKLTPTDPRQAMLTYMMPVMMLFFLYGFPSGLALYWTVVNLLSVGQQILFNREAAATPPGAGAAPA
jgi:YidC/Oxa1 family membrane protein insertase